MLLQDNDGIRYFEQQPTQAQADIEQAFLDWAAAVADLFQIEIEQLGETQIINEKRGQLCEQHEALKAALLTHAPLVGADIWAKIFNYCNSLDRAFERNLSPSNGPDDKWNGALVQSIRSNVRFLVDSAHVSLVVEP